MESLLHSSNIFLFGTVIEDLEITGNEGGEKKLPKRKSGNNQLGRQFKPDSKFARIYAFSYEGVFYELPWAALFLVHGDGDSVTNDNMPQGHGARAPTSPLMTGLGATDLQFADDVRYWSYDKADYTIRMDVETGMFEQVLLDVVFNGPGPGPGGVAGANVRGANVRGANVRGANVRGANVRGANVRGGGGGD